MGRLNLRMAATWCVLAVFALPVAFSTVSQAQVMSVDPAAVQILQRMTDCTRQPSKIQRAYTKHPRGRTRFGTKDHLDVPADVVVSRPNQLLAERKGDLIDQSFFYNGESLTLYNPSDKVYATESAPGTIEEVLDFARESLGLIVPVADLVYRNAYTLLMQDVTFAVIVGKAVIGGVKCNHLLFSRPGVDFQLWVADSGQPLPYKYVVTDTGVTARLSVTTVMSDWNAAPTVADAQFTFVPPKEAKLIQFMPF